MRSFGFAANSNNNKHDNKHNNSNNHSNNSNIAGNPIHCNTICYQYTLRLLYIIKI